MIECFFGKDILYLTHILLIETVQSNTHGTPLCSAGGQEWLTDAQGPAGTTG